PIYLYPSHGPRCGRYIVSNDRKWFWRARSLGRSSLRSEAKRSVEVEDRQVVSGDRSFLYFQFGTRTMGKSFCDIRILLVVAAAAFIFIQVPLLLLRPWPFCRNDEEVGRESMILKKKGTVIGDRNMVALVRLFATQSEYADRLAAAVSKANKLKDEESAQLKTILQDLKSMPLQELSILSIGIYA
ncbi:hypothetical protein GW17_00044323, partial [Ensete ventricosum]